VSSLKLSRLCSVRFVFVSTFNLQLGRAFVVGITNFSKYAVCVKAKAPADYVKYRITKLTLSLWITLYMVCGHVCVCMCVCACVRHAVWLLVGGNRVLPTHLTAVVSSELRSFVNNFNKLWPTSRIVHVSIMILFEWLCVLQTEEVIWGLRKHQTLYYSGLRKIRATVNYFHLLLLQL